MAAASPARFAPEQIAAADSLFFDLCLAHSPDAYAAMAPQPATLSRRHAQAMLRAARVLYRALLRNSASDCWPVPPFPLRDQVGGCQAATPPFWARFDAFVRQDGGGIFFAELNLDRPGGHRESLADPHHGPAFRRRFLRAVQDHWARYAPAHRRGLPPRAAFLVDPAHREELHIAHLYAGLLAELSWPCLVVGPGNLAVAGDTALAFGQPIDLLLRQFPLEFFHEVPAAPDLLHLHASGRLLLLNDPAAVIGQAKTCFAWLWEQVLAARAAPGAAATSLLTPGEIAVVQATVPFTAGMTGATLPADPSLPAGPHLPAPLALLQEPARWVLKPVLGRYSQGVTVGALAGPVAWGEAVAAALAEPEFWIAQQYVPPLAQGLTRWEAGTPTAMEGTVNWGIHLLGGRLTGLMARCSRGPVTDDAWFAPVALQ